MKQQTEFQDLMDAEIRELKMQNDSLEQKIRNLKNRVTLNKYEINKYKKLKSGK